MWQIVLLYTICASMFTLSKAVLAYTQPIFYVAVRMLFAGVLLGGYYLFRVARGHEALSFKRSDLFLLAQIVLFHIYLTYICDICALQELTSIESAFIYNLSPFIAALGSYFFFGELMTKRKWIGLGIGFSSFIPDVIHYGINPTGSISWMPRLITLFAVISSTYGWIIMRKLVKDEGYSPIWVNSIGMFIGGALALGTSLLFEPWIPAPVSNWPAFIQLTLLIVVVANIIFYNFYGYLLQKYTATFLSFAGFLCPIITAVLGKLFLNEPIGWHIIASFVIVSIGLYLFHQEELKQGY